MIRAWDVESGKLLSSFRATQKDEALWSVTITGTASACFVGGAVGWGSGYLHLWDMEKVSIIREFRFRNSVLLEGWYMGELHRYISR